MKRSIIVAAVVAARREGLEPIRGHWAAGKHSLYRVRKHPFFDRLQIAEEVREYR